MVGLDGSGKTTLARNLCCLAASGNRFTGLRYFHWRPKVFKNVEFPLPEYRDLARNETLSRHLFTLLLSAARLIKNMLLNRMAYCLRVRPLLRRGYLVFVDRYYYNYHLDPISVKYAGLRWFLHFMQRYFPQPDVVVTLRAPKAILLQRKHELSDAEATRQAAVLDELQFGTAQVIHMDSSQPADKVAQTTMDAILKAVEPA